MQLRKYFAALSAALLLTGAAVVNAAALTPTNVTWNPSGAGISTAGAFTFNNVVLNTYLTLDVTGGTAFSEQGYLRLSVFTNAGIPTAIPTAGFPSGTPYSLYIAFNATGTQSAGTPSTGTSTSLTYSLLGAPGVTTFQDTLNNGIFNVVGAAPVTLATGSLVSPGSTSLTVDPGTGLLLPAAQVVATFLPNPAFASFFVTPPSTTALTVTAAFTSTGTVITQFSPGGNVNRLRVDGGGGNATLALAPIPEPDTYGMLLAGLGLFGFIARRKAKREVA